MGRYLIIQGRKTLELRTWTVKYHGPLAIHASQSVERDACLAHGLDPDQVTTGAVIGVVDLAAIEELDAPAYVARQTEHLADNAWDGGPLYGWRLANPRALTEPMPLPRAGWGCSRRRLRVTSYGLRVPSLGWITRQPANPPTRNPQPATRQPATLNCACCLSLQQVLASQHIGWPCTSGRWSRPPTRKGCTSRSRRPRAKSLNWADERSTPWPIMWIEALRANDYKPTKLDRRREPFALAEETGVRLGLLFLAIRPITKVERIEVIAQEYAR